MGRDEGIREEQVTELDSWRESAAFDASEKAVLAYADAMCSTPCEVPEAVFETLRRHFDEEQVVELTSAIAWENYRARFDHALGMESEGFSDGAVCALPARS